MSSSDAPKSAVMRTDPSRAARRVGSLVMRAVAHPQRRAVAHRLAEWRRRLSGAPRRVEYFHEVEDPYSHLAAQTLEALAEAYEIEIVPQLAAPAIGQNVPEPERLAAYARKDAADVAPHYGLSFPPDAAVPAPESLMLARRILAGAAPESFARRAVEVGEALWSADKDSLAALADGIEIADAAAAQAQAEAGRERRERRGHYSGATFHFAGEWFWGVDRLHHLERRLAGLAAERPGAQRVAPRPGIDAGEPRAAPGRIALDFFPSLRSPYSAIAYDRALALAEHSGVELVLRPVLPMVMRGVPATLSKGLYISSDAWREAAVDGVSFGRIVDPIGAPVERAFSLFPWARDCGRGAEFLGSFLRAAWAEGVDTSTDAALQRVVERAGLSWDEARGQLGNDAWREELEENRLVMYDELGLWGVPSYRIRGPEPHPDFATWGADRLWLVAAELRRRIAGDVG